MVKRNSDSVKSSTNSIQRCRRKKRRMPPTCVIEQRVIKGTKILAESKETSIHGRSPFSLYTQHYANGGYHHNK